jgi:hypothetical protein
MKNLLNLLQANYRRKVDPKASQKEAALTLLFRGVPPRRVAGETGLSVETVQLLSWKLARTLPSAPTTFQ